MMDEKKFLEICAMLGDDQEIAVKLCMVMLRDGITLGESSEGAIGAISISEIAKTMGIAEGEVRRLLKKLEEAGLISEVRHLS